METLMPVLASDSWGVRRNGNINTRWAYMYDTKLVESAVGGEYAWPAYIRAIHGHSGADPDLMDRVEFTEYIGEYL